jgi:TolA-binding protein
LAAGFRTDAAAWAREHLREVVVAGGLLVAVPLIVWFVVVSGRRKELAASLLLTQARGTVEAGNLPLAANDLSRLVSQFSGTKAADQGVLLLNQIRLLQGQREPAVKSLNDFVASDPPADVAAGAYAMLAGALEDQGKTREAAAAYREAARHARFDFLKAEYLVDASRAFAASGDTAAARLALGEVLRSYGDLPEAAEAHVRMGEVGGVAPAAEARRGRGAGGATAENSAR